MADLPEDAIDEILLRLPVKSILRFESVSKSWRSLISASDFAKRHLLQPQTQARSRILIPHPRGGQSLDARSYGNDESDRGGVDLEYPLESSTRITKILHSCNGLLCLIDSSDNPILCNPSTRELNLLPNPSLSWEKRHFVFGFGYDRSSDDYKIIRLGFWSEGESITEIDVFRLKTSQWRRVNETHPSSIASDRVIFHNGLIYWLAWQRLDQNLVIISFDLEQERLELVVRLPSVIGNLNLSVIGGRLSVIYLPYPGWWDSGSVQIWVVHEESGMGRWTSLSSFPQGPPPLCWDSALLTDGKELMLIMNGRELIMHNFKTGKTKCKGNLHYVMPNPMFYTETLISPHGTKEAAS